MSPKRLFALLVVCLCAAACSRGDYKDQVLGTLERDRLELIAEASEPLVEIDVHEGDHVAAGAKLARLDLGPMQARLGQALAARAVAEHRLDELVKGPRAQEIAEARAALEAAESSLVTAENELHRVQGLVADRLISMSELDHARAERDNAAGTRKQAAARLHLLIEGTRIEEVQQAEAALEQARAALAEIQTSAARYVVTAPRNGRVEAIPYKLGERPATGAPVIVMLADGTPYARVYVPEVRRLEFAPGTKVRMSVDGRDQPLGGVVRFISAQAAFTPYYALTQEDRTHLSYLAEIDITDPAAGDVPTGIPVQVVLAERK